ncbi:MAG: hypothetical protein ABJA79_02105 [Parafilimonas sp.]
MGMFDNVKVSPKFLPDNVRQHTEGWQTKSHDRALNLLTVEKDGKLYIDNIIDNWERNGENKFPNYTGELRL